MSIFYQPDIQQGVHLLDQEESRHCVKVLRKKAGDSIQITDGQGYFYEAVISQADPKACVFEILRREKQPSDSFWIHIALSPTKNMDRMEWFVEKATEIGIHQISFLHCDNSERKVLKSDRLMRKAISAMKQSQQAYLPKIGVLTKFEKFIEKADADCKLMAHLEEESCPQLINAATLGASYLVLIGPEGDFSSNEVRLAKQHSFQTVSLGNNRLRTETAGIAACHSLQVLQLLQTN